MIFIRVYILFSYRNSQRPKTGRPFSSIFQLIGCSFNCSILSTRYGAGLYSRGSLSLTSLRPEVFVMLLEMYKHSIRIPLLNRLFKLICKAMMIAQSTFQHKNNRPNNLHVVIDL